jgi:VanZ family protein
MLHALGFALFVLPLVATWPRKWWAFVIAASVFGVAIEGLQMFTDRATELEDIVANSVGATLGAAVGWVIARANGQRAGDDKPPPP